MIEIWKVIAEIGIELHPDRVEAIASKITSLNSYRDFEKIKSSFGPGTDPNLIDRLEYAWSIVPKFSPLELAAALRGAVGTATFIEKRENIEMVWTGPSTGLVASRHTEQVLLEVLNAAKFRIFLVSFVAFDIDSIMKALQNAVGRNVKVDILLESYKDHGGQVNIDSVKAFLKHIPAGNIYKWGQGVKSPGTPIGTVHAKCAVADGNLAFITSANITTAAMERNMELGVLIRGGSFPETLERHLEALITTKIVEKI